MHVYRVIVVFIFFINLPPILGLPEARSEALVIPDIGHRPSSAPESTPRPARGMTMDQVREQFGAPRDVMGPVGNPPITRWVYPNFVVHFEDEYVIHSAANRSQ